MITKHLSLSVNGIVHSTMHCGNSTMNVPGKIRSPNLGRVHHSMPSGQDTCSVDYFSNYRFMSLFDGRLHVFDHPICQSRCAACMRSTHTNCHPDGSSRTAASACIVYTLISRVLPQRLSYRMLLLSLLIISHIHIFVFVVQKVEHAGFPFPPLYLYTFLSFGALP